MNKTGEYGYLYVEHIMIQDHATTYTASSSGVTIVLLFNVGTDLYINVYSYHSEQYVIPANTYYLDIGQYQDMFTSLLTFFDFYGSTTTRTAWILGQANRTYEIKNLNVKEYVSE